MSKRREQKSFDQRQRDEQERQRVARRQVTKKRRGHTSATKAGSVMTMHGVILAPNATHATRYQMLYSKMVAVVVVDE